jgi:hypothetical protein
VTLLARICADHTGEFYAVDRSTGRIRALTAAEFERGERDGTLGADFVCLSLAQARAKSARILTAIFTAN